MHTTVEAGRAMTALLIARPGAQAELLQTLQGLASDLERQPGCTACVLAQEISGGPRFLLYMSWSDLRAMRNGMASEPYRVLLGATSTLSAARGLSFLPSMSLPEVRRMVGEALQGEAALPSPATPRP